MPRIAGVTTKKDIRGTISHVTISLKKNEEAVTPLLKQLGILEKSKFQQECEAGFTIEEALAMNLKHIDDLWKK